MYTSNNVRVIDIADNVDEEKLLNDVDNYHTVISKIVGTEVNLVGLSKVPAVSIKEIAYADFDIQKKDPTNTKTSSL